MPDNNIVTIQKALIAKGFSVGPSGPDGIIGPDTEKAIVAFKKSVGLRARPYLGPITLSKLLDIDQRIAEDWSEARLTRAEVQSGGEPRWLTRARKFSGLQEIHGAKHAPEILEMWKTLGIPIFDDETAWCAAFVGYILETSGIESTRKANALSYEKWGIKLPKPVIGAVATKHRGTSGWQGHVFFVAGKDSRGNILGLGGNQSDAVNIKTFSPDEISGYFWPKGEPLPDGSLPVGSAAASTKED